MNWAIAMDMSTLMCIKWMTDKNLLYKKISKIKFKKKKTKMLIPRDTCTSVVHCSFIYNSQDMEAIQYPSLDEWING